MNASDHGTILIVDDEPSICWGFEKMLSREGYDIVTASSAEEALEVAAKTDIALAVIDVRLPGKSGIDVLPNLLELIDSAPVIVMTAFGDLETAVAAVRGGAADYLTKPFRLEDARDACQRALRARATLDVTSDATGQEEDTDADASLLVGQSAAMQQVFRQIALVADSELSVLITGETGTGKELVSAAIHRHSKRCDHPYLPIAPVTLSDTVLESELFGHTKGAFTGAATSKEGLFELANGGTLLLDEIGDLPMSTQVKLLRVLELGEYTAVGDVRPRNCDVRLIAATNRDLSECVAEGTFREDLLYRLAAVSIHVPPLRQRAEDIPMLCEYFLRRVGYQNPSRALDSEVLDALASRPWYGNVRELRNAVEHASVMARGRPIELGDFPEPQRRSVDASPGGIRMEEVLANWTRDQLLEEGDIDDLNDRFLAAVEPAMLRIVLEHTSGNRAAASQILGLHRGTLRERIKRYGLD